MEETSVDIIGIIVAAVLMFLVPFVLIADRNDDISQLIVQTATSSFVDNVIKTGKITSQDYQNYIKDLQSSGNTYDLEIEIKILDENTSKKYTETNKQIGENAYYSLFTTQVEEKILKSSNQREDDDGADALGVLNLKEGDIISVTAKNSSKTLSQTLKNIYYTISGDGMKIIVATGSGTIAVDGAN